MVILERIGFYFQTVLHLASDPLHLAILFGSVILGIMFGAMPGLTSTLGVALLTALTYGMDTATAMICLLAIYVGGTYGGSYASILINIPGTAASAATATLSTPRGLFRLSSNEVARTADEIGRYGITFGAMEAI